MDDTWVIWAWSSPKGSSPYDVGQQLHHSSTTVTSLEALRTLYLSAVDVLSSIQIDAQDAKYEPPKGWMMDKQQLWVVRKISEDCNYLERAHTSTHVSRI